MIGRLTGKLAAKNPPQIVIDVQGVGYEVDVPMSTFYNLPELGGSLTLLTHMAIREDGHFLYGFASEDERFTFRQLLKISGIGARTALAVLSGLSVSDLAAAIAAQEAGRLQKVPGIGKKTAERLLLELKGKLPGATAAQGGRIPNMPNAADDILNALLALGYNAKEADNATKSLPEGIDTAEGIRQALRGLAKL